MSDRNDASVERPAVVEALESIGCLLDEAAAVDVFAACSGREPYSGIDAIEVGYRLERLMTELAYITRIARRDLGETLHVNEVRVAVGRASRALDDLQSAERKLRGASLPPERHDRIAGSSRARTDTTDG